MVQITHFEPDTQLIESLVWSGFGGGLVTAAIAMAQRIVPGFDPYRVKPHVTINHWNIRVYLHGEPALAPFDEVALGAVDNRILALSIGLAKLHWSYLHPLVVRGTRFGAIGFHSDAITPEQQTAMRSFAGKAEDALERIWE